MMHGEMPKINECNAVSCVYNKNKYCNTIAITVGGPGHSCPMCDTAMFVDAKAGFPFINSEVGACRQPDCKYNNSWECTAQQGIQVGVHDNHPDCMTYDPRK